MMAARSHPEPALALGGAWPQAARPAAVAEPPLLRFVVVPVFGRRAWSRQSAALAAKRALDLLGAACCSSCSHRSSPRSRPPCA